MTARVTTTPLLQVRNLSKNYPVTRGLLRRVVGQARAADQVSFDVFDHETLGLVGESGCGKTTVAKMIVRAIEPTGGQLLFSDSGRVVDLARLRGRELKPIRRHVQMIFQDPYGSLNPRHRVRDIIGEPLVVNKVAGKELERRVAELMEQVGLRPETAIRYPHAFSGGQRQRIGIARALALNPRLVVCDEPVSALDMSVQAQVLNLLKDLQDTLGLSYILVSHDLGVVQHVSDRVAVMYLGRLVEVATTSELFARPRHPYTDALLAAAPRAHPRYRGHLNLVTGEPADTTATAAGPTTGCRFRTRCPYAQPVCAEHEPTLQSVGTGTGTGTGTDADTDAEHLAACHFADTLRLTGAATDRAVVRGEHW